MDKGTRIGPFVVLRLLGAGGMGRVYLAEHSLMKDLHAIKVLDPQLTQNPQIVTRFVNEARAAANLRHRNLVRVHNIERMPDDGPWFMVLDYLDGGTLARFMASHRGPMVPNLIVHILAQVANCIQHVHDHNIVHRDLKPDNIFLIQHGDDAHFPVVLDLGVAQLSKELSSGPATKTGTVIGTPIYMAPEQLRGERVSPAADVFALGVIAYEMSTGGFFPYQYDESRSAYFGLPATEIYYRQRSAPPHDPLRRFPGLGKAWVNMLHAALALDPRARPASVREFALMLANAATATESHLDGRSIVREVARELIHCRGSDNDTRRLRSPVQIARTSRAASRIQGCDPSGPRAGDMDVERTALAEPVTTLAGAASQSIADMRPARRWRMITGRGALALLTAVTMTFAVVRWSGFADARHDDRTSAATGESRGKLAQVVSDAVVSVRSIASRTMDGNRVDLDAGIGGKAFAIKAGDPPATVVTPTIVPDQIEVPHAVTAPDPRPLPTESLPRPSITANGTRAHATPLATAVKRTGELVIIVKPWALIWLNGKPLGQTPFRENVAAGGYRLRLANDNVGKDETTIITVNPDHTTTIQRSW